MTDDARNGPAPTASDGQLLQISSAIDAHEKLQRSTDIVKLIVGVPLSLIAPHVLAGFVVIIFYVVESFIKIVNERFSAPPAAWTYWLSYFALLPLLFWHTRVLGNYSEVTEAAWGMDDPSKTASRGEWNMGVVGILVGVYTEILLWPYRAVWRAWDAWNEKEQHRGVDRPLAVSVLFELQVEGKGLELRKLGLPSDAGTTLSYLLHYDWIGVSKNRDRIWISTEGKRRIEGHNAWAADRKFGEK